jgi:hypothetical protein
MAGLNTPGDDRPKRRRKRRRLSEADVGLFIQKYGRKAHPKFDPNDRHYSRDVESKIKRMKPEDLDRLMRGDDPES